MTSPSKLKRDIRCAVPVHQVWDGTASYIAKQLSETVKNGGEWAIMNEVPVFSAGRVQAESS